MDRPGGDKRFTVFSDEGVVWRCGKGWERGAVRGSVWRRKADGGAIEFSRASEGSLNQGGRGATAHEERGEGL